MRPPPLPPIASLMNFSFWWNADNLRASSHFSCHIQRRNQFSDVTVLKDGHVKGFFYGWNCHLFLYIELELIRVRLAGVVDIFLWKKCQRMNSCHHFFSFFSSFFLQENCGTVVAQQVWVTVSNISRIPSLLMFGFRMNSLWVYR